ncbi:MAG: hypothetical protein ACR2P5_02190 [Gammaproteobacteria bacterium]
MKTILRGIFAVFAAAAFVAVGGCAKEPGPKLREIERVSEMSDEEIAAAREACHLISTSDYNCSELVNPVHGMTPEEWKILTESTKECRKNQLFSFHHCLRGKGVRYSEFN